MGDVLLNVADIRLRSRVNGPGLRSVVWVQGCTIGCPGCFNPHTHAHKPVRLLDPEELGRELLEIKDTDGLTISGGEPFEQAEACAVLAATVRSAERSVMVFTGYYFEFLRNSSLVSVKRFLANIDLLVAGPYVEHLQSDGTCWRGSTNQTVHLLTNRLASATNEHPRADPVVEVRVDGTALACTGFPDPLDQAWLDQFAEVRSPLTRAGRRGRDLRPQPVAENVTDVRRSLPSDSGAVHY